MLATMIHNLPFKYVGGGQVIIGGLNPDFISTDSRHLIIELFGHGFHDPNSPLKKGHIPYRQTVEGRTLHFRQHGYETLIIWDTELKNEAQVLGKVAKFIQEGGDS